MAALEPASSPDDRNRFPPDNREKDYACRVKRSLMRSDPQPEIRFGLLSQQGMTLEHPGQRARPGECSVGPPSARRANLPDFFAQLTHGPLRTSFRWPRQCQFRGAGPKPPPDAGPKISSLRAEPEGLLHMICNTSSQSRWSRHTRAFQSGARVSIRVLPRGISICCLPHGAFPHGVFPQGRAPRHAGLRFCRLVTVQGNRSRTP